MFLACSTRTMAGARQIVQDNEPGIPPRRAKLIDMAARWRAEQAKKNAQPPRVAPLRVDGCRLMPQWAADVVAEVAAVHSVKPEQLLSKSRLVKVVCARNEVFYRLRDMVSPVTGARASFPQIAAWFGREHTGVMWGAARHAVKNELPLLSALNMDGKLARGRAWHRRAKA